MCFWVSSWRLSFTFCSLQQVWGSFDNQASDESPTRLAADLFFSQRFLLTDEEKLSVNVIVSLSISDFRVFANSWGENDPSVPSQENQSFRPEFLQRKLISSQSVKYNKLKMSPSSCFNHIRNLSNTWSFMWLQTLEKRAQTLITLESFFKLQSDFRPQSDWFWINWRCLADWYIWLWSGLNWSGFS